MTPPLLLRSPSITVRCASALYELFLLTAVCFIFSYLYLALTQQTYPLGGTSRHIFQLYLFLVVGGYFILFWCRGGQTLAMKTWRVRLIRQDGKGVSPREAWFRYLLSWVSFSACLLGFMWAWIDRDQQFLHDRILGTRLISTRE